jgi:hypothetical protein
MRTPTYTQGADLPDLPIDWEDSSGDLHNFEDGWTFTLRIGTPGQAAVLEKTDTIVGQAASPNVTIQWEAGELDDITPGTHYAHLRAVRDSDGKKRILPFRITVRKAVQAAA